jgi:metallo-beta-lactamase superfamily protein
MDITIIGCGNAFSNRNYNQCFMLEENGRRMLIDYGYQVPAALYHAGIDIFSIDDIYVSHLHSDHVGGLEQIAFLRYDWVNMAGHFSERDERFKAPRLIGNVKLLDDLWQKSLRGGLESMEGFDASMDTFFEPMPIMPNEKLVWEGWECSLVQQVHIMTGSIISNTFGLIMEKEHHDTVYFTTDAQHCSPKQVEIFYNRADVIFQDCECVGVDTKERKFYFSSGVHANYAQLAGFKTANSILLSDEVKKKMYLSHYQDFVSDNKDFYGNDCDWDKFAESDGFKGFIKLGDVIKV